MDPSSCNIETSKMPITALPETTVRLLGSAAAISTPVDVIKELLGNSLDAEATSVEILVSANLVDSIQVRDNGHGIQAGDYNSLGRMGHTSKLTSFEELQTVGGNTLGFRGQALASANSLGRVTVVTREAVVQIFGTGVMSECLLKNVTTDAFSCNEKNARDVPRMSIEAVLPKPDADLSKLSKGSFFSIDSRPVSTSHGTMKKLLSNFKIHFKKPFGADAGDKRLSDLFICVNVKCSPGTYDPNVEPSKSQVLFADESQLVDLFEELWGTHKTDTNANTAAK
ncbi:putative dna mismatch repair [Diaporthe ampelina]|uniref:Putative dna mismatch repair n=1 Tax=Diaporthe ampelina TaxID=1214573 RepID=A0A0G2FS30_9PEZI|nr:putative dna mismatch repair [Diaporthe ampelina]